MPNKAETLCITLQHPEIDKLHAEMLELVSTLSQANADAYQGLYTQLIKHTEQHFSYEERLMQEGAYPHTAEHLLEHRQMLSEMKRFQQRNRALARAYIAQRLPERLNLHINRLDSQLAAWLHSSQSV
jgi:hemerythrin